MKRRAIILIAICVLVFLLFLPSCGGSGGESGGITVTRDMLVGTWVMSTTGGLPCTGCVVLRLYANGSVIGTDTYGYFVGWPGTYKGNWEYSGGQLSLRTAGFYDLSNVSMPSINELHLSGSGNTNVYVRGQ